ncbi:MAG: hypothetical protein Q8865_03065 [Bacillota bacterium]|nr:hypothetical protein [Bacillota bacterium]
MEKTDNRYQGIAVFASIFYIIACLMIIMPGTQVFGVVFSAVCGVTLIAGGRYKILTIATVALTAYSFFGAKNLAGALCILLIIFPLSIIMGLGAVKKTDIKILTVFGAELLTAAALGIIAYVVFKINGKLTITDLRSFINNLIDGISQSYAGLMRSMLTGNPSAAQQNEINSIAKLLKQTLGIEFPGIIIVIATVTSFAAAVVARATDKIVSGDKRKLLEDFRVSRAGAVLVIIAMIASVFLGNFANVMLYNFVFVMTPAFILEGILYLIRLFKNGMLIRSPLMFYIIVFGLFFIGVMKLIVFFGLYDALRINWSKLIKRPDDEDF